MPRVEILQLLVNSLHPGTIERVRIREETSYGHLGLLLKYRLRRRVTPSCLVYELCPTLIVSFYWKDRPISIVGLRLGGSLLCES